MRLEVNKSFLLSFVFVIFFLFSCRIYYKFSDSTLIYNILSIVIYLSFFFSIVISKPGFRIHWHDYRYEISLVLICLLSSLWSINSISTMKSSVFLLLTTLIVILYTSRLTIDDLIGGLDSEGSPQLALKNHIDSMKK